MIYDNNLPIYLQVINDIKKRVVTGDMKAGEKMPSARDLALQYQINPNTSQRVYKELEMESICVTKRGLGTFVTEDTEKIERMREEMASQHIIAFIKGMKGLGYNKEELIHILEHEFDDAKPNS